MPEVKIPTIEYYLGTQEEYTSLEPKLDNALYFIKDTKRIYKGTELYADGTAGGGSADLDGYVHTPTYEKNVLTLQVHNGPAVTVDFTEMLKDNFLKSAKYYESYEEGQYVEDPQKNVIVFVVGDQPPVIVPVGALIDTYTAAEGGTNIKVKVENNQISAELVIADSGDPTKNVVVLQPDGSLVAQTKEEFIGDAVEAAIQKSLEEAGTLKEELDKKVDKMDIGEEDEVVLSTAEGGVKRSGVKVGTTQFAEAGNDTTLATEAAVKDALRWRRIVPITKETVNRIISNAMVTVNEKIAAGGDYANVKFDDSGADVTIKSSGMTTVVTKVYTDIFQTLISALQGAKDTVNSITGKTTTGVEGATIDLQGESISAVQVVNFVKSLGLKDGENPLGGATQLSKLIGQSFTVVVNDVDGGQYEYPIEFLSE